MDLLKYTKLMNSYLWDYFLMYCLMGTGVFFTIILGFPQIRRFFKMFKVTFGGIFRKKDDGEISSFNALAVAIAGQVGTGNVAGVATAIAGGGPGAIFWMWVSGIVGMSTIYAEAVIAQVFRQKGDDGYYGGPAYYMRDGLKNKKLGSFLGYVFAVLIVVALGFIGNAVQANSISGAVYKAVDKKIPIIVIGIIIAVVAGLVFMGGIKRIANFATLVVPFMAILYIAFGIIIIFKFRANIGLVFSEIFRSAFSSKAVAGGVAGYSVKMAMQKGICRGLFSNEAGMGSTPHAHATAVVKHPVEQGLTAMMGVLVDTLVICTFTALIILLTGANTVEGLKGANITQEGFKASFGHVGVILLAVCLTFFAFTTIVGWYYYGEANIRFLFGNKAIRPYQIAVLAFIVYGSVKEVDLVWELADFFNGLMVIPNLIALIALYKIVLYLKNDYIKCERLGQIHYDYKN